MGFSGGTDSKGSVGSAGDLGSIPGLGRSPERALRLCPVLTYLILQQLMEGDIVTNSILQ